MPCSLEELALWKELLNANAEVLERSGARNDDAATKPLRRGLRASFVDVGKYRARERARERSESGRESCGACGKGAAEGGGRLKTCAKCQGIAYCSPGCQAKHWPQHKRFCRSASEPDGASVVLPAVPAGGVLPPEMRYTSSIGVQGSSKVHDTRKAPKNPHGDKRFVVKASEPHQCCCCCRRLCRA